MDKSQRIKYLFLIIMVLFIISAPVFSQKENTDWKEYAIVIKKNIYNDYKGMFREEGNSLKYPFITPGSSQYADVLWDWDSWLMLLYARYWRIWEMKKHRKMR